MNGSLEVTIKIGWTIDAFFGFSDKATGERQMRTKKKETWEKD